MVVRHIQRRLQEKSDKHSMDLQKLGKSVPDEPFSPNVILMDDTPQFLGMYTTLQNVQTQQDDFVVNFDSLAALMIEKYGLTLLPRHFWWFSLYLFPYCHGDFVHLVRLLVHAELTLEN